MTCFFYQPQPYTGHRVLTLLSFCFVLIFVSFLFVFFWVAFPQIHEPNAKKLGRHNLSFKETLVGQFWGYQ